MSTPKERVCSQKKERAFRRMLFFKAELSIKRAVATARVLADGGAAPAKIRVNMAGPLQTLKSRLLTIKVVRVLSMPRRQPLGMVLNEVIAADTMWSEQEPVVDMDMNGHASLTPFDSLHTLPSLSSAMALSPSTPRRLRKRHMTKGVPSVESPSRARRSIAFPEKATTTMMAHTKVRPTHYSSTIQPTQNFVVQEYRIVLDPMDFQPVLLQKSTHPFEVNVYQRPFARGSTKQAFKMRLKADEGIAYAYTAKELFRDETGDTPSYLGNKDHLLQELARVEQARDILAAFQESWPCLTALEVTDSSLYEVVLPPDMGRSWLVEPYISSDSPRKFSGTDAAGAHAATDAAGATVDCLAHFSYLHTQGTLVLVDLQDTHVSRVHCSLCRNSTNKDNRQLSESGLGDLGQNGLDNFIAQHSCGTMCESLALKDMTEMDSPSPTKSLGSVQTRPLLYQSTGGQITELRRNSDGAFKPAETSMGLSHRGVEEAAVAPQLQTIGLFILPDNMTLAPAEVVTVTNKSRLIKLSWPAKMLSVDPANADTLPLSQQLRPWAHEAAKILCGIVPHSLMHEGARILGGLGRSRTRGSKAECESEWVQERQTDIYSHEQDAIVDWLSHDVQPECTKLVPDISTEYLRDLCTGPGLVLGGLAVAMCLLDRQDPTLDLTSMYEHKARLLRQPRPQILEAYSRDILTILAVAFPISTSFARAMVSTRAKHTQRATPGVSSTIGESPKAVGAERKGRSATRPSPSPSASTLSSSALMKHFFMRLHNRSQYEPSDDLPGYAADVISNMERELVGFWSTIKGSAEKRQTLSALVKQPTTGRYDSVKHCALGIRYCQFMSVLRDRTFWAFEDLPPPAQNRFPADLDIPTTYFPTGHTGRTKCYLDVVNKFCEHVNEFFNYYTAHDDLRSPSSSSETDIDAIINMTENMYLNEHGIPKLPADDQPTPSSGRKVNRRKARPLSTGHKPSDVLRPLMMAMFLSPTVMFMRQNLMENDLSLHVAAESHVKHGAQYPVNPEDDSAWAFLHLEHSRHTIRGGPKAILRVVVEHLYPVLKIPFQPPMPFAESYMSTVSNDVPSRSSSIQSSDEDAALSESSSPASPPSSFHNAPRTTSRNWMSSAADDCHLINIPVGFPQYVESDATVGLGLCRSYPRSAMTFFPWMKWTAKSWAEVISGLEGRNVWQDSGLMTPFATWLAFMKYCLRGTGSKYWTIMRDFASFDLKNVPADLWQQALSIESGYRKKRGYATPK
ncbi:hypothetical protein CALCODRAFT_529504 [Calocera cornea HHB12733]|uniref:Alpha-type protein kinase domain-containing protein n=1 Tax=Calocera cornea HHB12733 TaxID=1353952 RepID=A0A165DNP3_9BASI|nr:hypothetical protein CALCODRAFT_529504 [Calocera cornea HHB12733]